MLKKRDAFKLPDTEEEVFSFWKEQHVFERSLAQRAPKKGSKKSAKKTFVFFEGPPTANGRPGIHHVLARSYKDIMLRYKTMRGYFVPRKGGWDTHGLPVELEVEKTLGLKSKKEIEQYGIAAFNKKCKESVWKYKDEWERLTGRMGFWLDMKNPYITYENDYIETNWWIFSEIAKRGLLYKGQKIVPWCTRCGTALSSHELAQGYKEVEDTSIYAKFKVVKGEKMGEFVADNHTYILSWTTTPWTLPGNVALAVGEKIEYAMVSVEEGKKKETYIIATPRLEVLKREYVHVGSVKGKDLVGIQYEPLFPVRAFTEGAAKKVSYRVYAADFVSTTDGTGVVHTAVMYGEDDYTLGKKLGLPQVHTVNLQGKFTDDVPKFAGQYVKAKETEVAIISALEHNGNLLRSEGYLHEYPFCWRCSSPLLYYGRDSWFIEMSKLREDLKKANATVHWVPENLREGRFGEWIREVKDWAISRERYWGTPLPIWACESCKKTTVIGGIKELEDTQKKSRNTYYFVRHGQSEANVKEVLSCWPEKTPMHLTLKGRTSIEALAKKTKKMKVDIIFSSDMTRTKETSAILKEAWGAPVIFDERLREINTGDFNGLPIDAYRQLFVNSMERFTKAAPKGETLTELRARTYSFISEMEKKYEGKSIAIVSHEDTLWLMASVMQGWTDEASIARREGTNGAFIQMGEMREMEYRTIPRDETGFFDVHRPYIDAITFPCKHCKGEMRRIPEVADVWFDSGAMPFAQAHFPFEKGGVKGQHVDFPADYITEGVDQTRGWFYTLLAVATLLKKKAPYKNVISLGLVLDKNGQKMSKSKGNIVSPWDMIQKHGVDAVRWYFYTVNPPGEAKKFDELEIAKVSRQFFTLVYNSFVFFNLYGKVSVIPTKAPASKNVLDAWVLARLHETIHEASTYLEEYEIGDAARRIETFAGDFSRWFIRRSRRRLQKPESEKELQEVSKIFGYVLLELARLLAPFTPFFADALYKSLITNAKASVHLDVWPTFNKKLVDKKLIEAMEEVRLVASVALAKRAEAGAKVRQPLASLSLKSEKLKGKKALLEILKDEVNVKEIRFDKTQAEDVILDLAITQELKDEGLLREFVRIVQDLRQDAGFSPKDMMVLHIEAPQQILYVLHKYETSAKRDVNAKVIEYKKVERFDAEIKTKLGDADIWLAVRKKE